MGKRIPERLTLVDDSDHPTTTLVVDDGQRKVRGDVYYEPVLCVVACVGEDGITVELNEKQAKQLRSRIAKFLREHK